MSSQGKQLYEFGPFRLDPEKRVLLREKQPVPLQLKAFETLLVLVRNSEQVVLKDDLMKAVWPDTFVEESNLAQNIFVLRKTLGGTVGDHRYIVAIPGRGYRFAEKARLISEEEESLVVESHSRTRVVIDESFQDAEKAAITPERAARGTLWKVVFGATMLVVVVAAGSYWYLRRPPKLTDKDMLVLADFANTTGDPVFDGALRQGLSVQLEQSPFLNVLSNQRIAQTLSLMTQPKDSRLSPELAREVCQRTASTAVLDGTIAQIGTRYLLTLTAINCSTGDMLASAEAKADDKDHVLDALGTVASDIRPKLGESLATVRKFDVTLRQATTSSLEALKALTVGEKFLYQKDTASAVPYFQRALELDPNFAMAYMQLGITYYSLSEPGRAKECFAKAFLLREHTSEREKLQIASAYYGHVTGEIDKAIQALQEVIEIYKHSSSYNGLTDLYARLGQYEKSADAARMLLTLDSYKNFGFVGLALDDMALQNFSGARQIIQQAQARAVDSYFLHIELYTLSFPAGGLCRDGRAATLVRQSARL